jgi:hypothetical protein
VFSAYNFVGWTFFAMFSTDSKSASNSEFFHSTYVCLHSKNFWLLFCKLWSQKADETV